MQDVRLLIVTGAPGTGKTTLARELARRLGATLIAKDTIKEALLDRLGASDAAASRALSDASFAALFALAQEQLGAGVSLILEGNFRVSEHATALATVLAGVPRVRIAQLLCTLPEAERRARLAARAHDPARHAGHRDQQLARAAQAADGYLELPGERFAHGGHGTAILAALEHWWRSR